MSQQGGFSLRELQLENPRFRAMYEAAQSERSRREELERHEQEEREQKEQFYSRLEGASQRSLDNISELASALDKNVLSKVRGRNFRFEQHLVHDYVTSLQDFYIPRIQEQFNILQDNLERAASQLDPKLHQTLEEKFEPQYSEAINGIVNNIYSSFSSASGINSPDVAQILNNLFTEMETYGGPPVSIEIEEDRPLDPEIVNDMITTLRAQGLRPEQIKRDLSQRFNVPETAINSLMVDHRRNIPPPPLLLPNIPPPASSPGFSPVSGLYSHGKEEEVSSDLERDINLLRETGMTDDDIFHYFVEQNIPEEVILSLLYT